jgi:hypothetical protein
LDPHLPPQPDTAAQRQRRSAAAVQPPMHLRLAAAVQVGRKPFNIRESESLRYAFLSLSEAPGLKDPRCALPLFFVFSSPPWLLPCCRLAGRARPVPARPSAVCCLPSCLPSRGRGRTQCASIPLLRCLAPRSHTHQPTLPMTRTMLNRQRARPVPPIAPAGFPCSPGLRFLAACQPPFQTTPCKPPSPQAAAGWTCLPTPSTCSWACSRTSPAAASQWHRWGVWLLLRLSTPAAGASGPSRSLPRG